MIHSDAIACGSKAVACCRTAVSGCSSSLPLGQIAKGKYRPVWGFIDGSNAGIDAEIGIGPLGVQHSKA
jgi:hypothetical protein